MIENILSPAEIVQEVENSGIKKAQMPIKRLFVMGILGGIYVSMSAQASLAATYAIPNVNVAKMIVGLMFCAGVIFSSVAGGEIFVGNSLMIVAMLSKKISPYKLLLNWAVVFCGNMVGGILIAFLINHSGQLRFSDSLLAATTIKTAVYKANIPFTEAIILGLLCNILICLAVWMSSAARSITSKVYAILFPIIMFNICGFENSVANVYFLSAGILAKSNTAFCETALAIGVSPELVASLNWGSLFHLIPVMIGNIIGGGVFVAGFYWLIHNSRLLD